jgi:hypothetical protein
LSLSRTAKCGKMATSVLMTLPTFCCAAKAWRRSSTNWLLNSNTHFIRWWGQYHTTVLLPLAVKLCLTLFNSGKLSFEGWKNRLTWVASASRSSTSWQKRKVDILARLAAGNLSPSFERSATNIFI